MSASIIVRTDQNCWGSQNEAPALPQQNPYGNGYSIPTRVASPQRHRGLSRIRIRVGSQRAHAAFLSWEKPTLNPAGKFLQSAAPSPLRSVIAAESSPGGGLTAGSLLPAWRGSRLFLNFFGALKALRSLTSLHRGSALFQSSERGAAPDFHFLALSAGFTGLVSTCDGHISTEGKSTCPTKEFPKSEKIFPGLT